MLTSNDSACVSRPVINTACLKKTFRRGFKTFKALDDISLSIMPGQMVGLIGASGSGKSTMLRNLAGLIVGDSGGSHIEVFGKMVQKDGSLAQNIREIRSRIGFIFQQFNIVGRLSVLTNVLVGTLGRIPSWRGTLGWFTHEEKKQALEALDRVGMRDCAMQRASTLSGGQQQRAAIARALLQKAEVILADEPIASLDPVAARHVMEILSCINREDCKTVIVSLHQVDYALCYCDRIVALKDGRIVYDGSSSEVTPQMLQDIYGNKLSESFMEDSEMFAARKNGNGFQSACGRESVLALWNTAPTV